MKLRHATALAFVGWYLLCPPNTCPLIDGQQCHEPLSQWRQIGATDTAQQCEDTLASLKENQKRMIRAAGQKEMKTANENIVGLRLMEHSLCVQSDDPRLKGN